MPDFSKISIIMLFTLVMALSACSKNSSDEGRYTSHKIDRQALVSRHNPQLTHLDYSSPFTVGNGQFAFTADITGLQSLAADYFTQGIPLETKARWAWHSRVNPNNYQLDDANQHYQAYGRDAEFPTNADTAAGQWLRQNPHDLPLARIALQYQGKPLQIEQLSAIEQRLDLWNGQLNSHYQLEGNKVDVMTIADAKPIV